MYCWIYEYSFIMLAWNKNLYLAAPLYFYTLCSFVKIRTCCMFLSKNHKSNEMNGNCSMITISWKIFLAFLFLCNYWHQAEWNFWIQLILHYLLIFFLILCNSNLVLILFEYTYIKVAKANLVRVILICDALPWLIFVSVSMSFLHHFVKKTLIVFCFMTVNSLVIFCIYHSVYLQVPSQDKIAHSFLLLLLVFLYGFSKVDFVETVMCSCSLCY